MKRTYRGTVIRVGDRVKLRDPEHFGTVQKVTYGGRQIHVLLDNGWSIERHASMFSHVKEGPAREADGI